MQSIDYVYKVTARGKSVTRRSRIEFSNTDPVPNILQMIESWNADLADEPWAVKNGVAYELVSTDSPVTVPGTTPLN